MVFMKPQQKVVEGCETITLKMLQNVKKKLTKQKQNSLL